MVQTIYAAGRSAKNMVEHCWASETNFFVEVIVTDKLRGELRIPYDQSGLDTYQKKENNAQLIDNAIHYLNKHAS